MRRKTELLVTPALFALAMILPAHAAQTPDQATATPATYPFIEASAFAGGPTVRQLKLTRSAGGRQAVADRLIVAFEPGLTEAAMAKIHRQAALLGAGAAKPVASLPNGFQLVDVTGAASVEAAAQAYENADPRVRKAGADIVGTADSTPNDPLASRQEPLQALAVTTAWDRSQGTGMTIAILDSGMDATHPDLAGKIDDQMNFIAGGIAADDTGHGTGVAGLAAAATNNMAGIAGVGFNARLLNAKVASGGFYPASAVAQGIHWATDRGAQIISMSFSFPSDCDSEADDIGLVRDAVEYAWNHNVVLVASAGNTGSTSKRMPASCPHVVSVAFTDNNDVMDPLSTHGTWVSLAAPGHNLVSTRFTRGQVCTALPDDPRYGTCDGTSFSTPLVSGIAALVRATCGPLNSTTFERLTSTADAIAGTGANWQYGRVNALRAVCLLQPTGLQDTGATPTSMGFIWNDRSNNETSFQLSYRLTGSGSWTTLTVPPNATSQATFTVQGLQTGVFYDFTVRACDSLGCSEDAQILTRRANFFPMHIARRGVGRVSSSPTGIDCGPTSIQCNASFAAGTSVALRALGMRDPNSRTEYDFDHWEGACSGTDECVLVMDRAADATAVFRRVAAGR